MVTMQDLKQALDATGLPFAHFAWARAPAGDHGVYAEDGAADFIADGLHAERATTGTVDWFTRDPAGPARAAIEEALERVAVWSLESIQYEDETRYTHYEWRFGLYG